MAKLQRLERRYLPRQIACLALINDMEGRETLGYLCKLGQLRDNGVVSESVFRNVGEDYEERLAEIAERRKWTHSKAGAGCKTSYD